MDHNIVPPVRISSNSFSADVGKLVTMRSNEVTLWDVKNSARLQTREVSVLAARVTLSPDGEFMAVQSGIGIDMISPISGLGHRILNSASIAVAFTPDSHRLRFVDQQSRIITWNVQEWIRETQVTAVGCQDNASSNSTVFSPDTARLASVGSNGNLALWNTQTGVKEREFHQIIGSAHTRFSSDGASFAIVSDVHNRILVWHLPTNTPPLSLPGAPDVSALCFSPDARFLAVAHGYDLTRLYRLANGVCERSVATAMPWFFRFTFTPDGHHIVYVDRNDHVVKVEVDDGFDPDEAFAGTKSAAKKT